MLNLVIDDMAAHFGDFKPTHVTDCFTSSIYRVVHCVFDAFRRGTDQLNLFVDVVAHKDLLIGSGLAQTGKSCEDNLPWIVLNPELPKYPQAKS
jgi:hypothetical protein